MRAFSTIKEYFEGITLRFRPIIGFLERVVTILNGLERIRHTHLFSFRKEDLTNGTLAQEVGRRVQVEL